MSTDRVALPPPSERMLMPPSRRTARRHRWSFALAAVAALIILGLIFVLGYIPRQKREQAAVTAAQAEANRIPVVQSTALEGVEA